MVVRASVVMACRNGAAHLAEALEAVLAQAWDEPWELGFADNGSTDGSLAIFQSYAAGNPRIRMSSVDAGDRPGKSHALNRGIAAAAGRAINLVDSDEVPAPGWLAAMGAALATHDSSRPAEQAATLGAFAGQLAGVIRYRAAPTTGRPPRDRLAPPTPLGGLEGSVA